MASRRPASGAAAAAIAAAVALVFSAMALAGDAPPRRRPVDGGAVLLELPPVISPRAGDAARPETSAEAAADEAGHWLRLARSSGDTRYFGRAAAAIRPWESAARVPMRIDLVAAELEQQRHAFDAARRRLDRVLAADPRHVAARLERANISLLTGDHDAARRDCLAMTRAGAVAPGAVCLAAAMTGPDSVDRARRLVAAIPVSADTSRELARWQLLTAADLADRAGDDAAVLVLLEDAHARDPASEEARARLAEAMLAHGDAGRALHLASAPNPSLARMLTGLRAALALGDPRATAWRRDIEASFVLARRRGEMPHDREEGLFALHVERDPARALTLARRNFDVQKDTADLRLLVEAAAAAGDAATLREARRWLESTGVEDYVARSRLKEAGA